MNIRTGKCIITFNKPIMENCRLRHRRDIFRPGRRLNSRHIRVVKNRTVAKQATLLVSGKRLGERLDTHDNGVAQRNRVEVEVGDLLLEHVVQA